MLRRDMFYLYYSTVSVAFLYGLLSYATTQNWIDVSNNILISLLGLFIVNVFKRAELRHKIGAVQMAH